MTDDTYYELAVTLAAESEPEDERPHPRVGVVVVRDGSVIASAARRRGRHAEYLVTEERAAQQNFAGTTVFTTLEPCTTRNHPKVPCAHRLAERKVARVMIGMLDPNPLITGKGVQFLRRHGIDVQLFPAQYVSRIEDLNREFIRAHSQSMMNAESAVKYLGSKRDVREYLDGLFLSAKVQIDILGMSLNDLFAGVITPEVIVRKISEGCVLRFFVLDPKSPVVDLRAADEGITRRQIHDGVFKSVEKRWVELNDLLATAVQIPLVHGRLDLIRYSSLPYFTVYRADDVLTFGLYNRNAACNTSAVFSVPLQHHLGMALQRDLDYLEASSLVTQRQLEFRGGSGGFFRTRFVARRRPQNS